ncbi:MAG: BrnA antitoxin family protein [Rhodospirillaceae bacterium]
MSEERIIRRSLKDARPGKTDWARVDALTDAEIEAAVAADPDAAPIMREDEIEDWFKNACVVMPPGKAPISIRIDRDVLDWFRTSGEPYQTKINAVLRAYMDHEKAGGRA